MPDESVRFSKQAVSRINFVLSFPLLLFMAAASHYPFAID